MLNSSWKVDRISDDDFSSPVKREKRHLFFIIDLVVVFTVIDKVDIGQVQIHKNATNELGHSTATWPKKLGQWPIDFMANR